MILLNLLLLVLYFISRMFDIIRLFSKNNKILNMIKHFLLLFLNLAILQAQDDINTTNSVPNDTLNLKLKFFPKDTLYYRVVTWDSIVINYNPALLKQRAELMRLTCDSVTKSGLMFLSQELIEFSSKEADGSGESATRTTSGWIGRKSTVVIDSNGKRHKQFYADDSKISVAPGGVFMPHLIFEINANEKVMNESWLINSADTLVENSFPPSILNHTNLMRISQKIDTLGYMNNEIMYIRTGNGSFHFELGENKVTNSVVINSSGILRISEVYNIPVHLFVTIEQKLTIYQQDDSTIPGKHFIHTDYYLERFIESPKRKLLKN